MTPTALQPHESRKAKNRSAFKKAVNRLLKLERETYQKACETLKIANALTLKVFSTLEDDALKTGNINVCLEVADRLLQSAALIAQNDSLAASITLQMSTLEAFSTDGGLA